MTTRVLAALLVLAYAASAYVAGRWWDIPADDLLRVGGAYGPAIASGERWRIVSAIFLHGGLLHLGFNLLALADFGSVLERRFGALPVAAIFFASGMAGFLASTLWHPEDVSIGASGALFGLLGWWAIAAWRLGEFLPPQQKRRRLLTLLVVIGVALGFGFVVPGIDNAAHLGGLAAGLILGGVATFRLAAVPFAAIAVSALAWAGTGALPDALALQYREGQRFDVVYQAFARDDRALSQALLALGEESRTRKISDDAALAKLQTVLIPGLARLVQSLSSERYATPRLEAERQRWARYAALRLEAVEGIRDAMTGRRPDGAAIFERKMNEAARIARAAGGKPPDPPRR
jgi:rhomboid protease GluP